MYKYLILIFITFYSIADFSGKWLGEGKYRTHKSQGECEQVYFELYNSADKLNIKTGGYQCDIFKAEYPSSEFSIVNNALLYEGEKVGTIKENKIFISYLDGVYQLKLEISDKKLYFKERWFEDGDLLEVESDLAPYTEVTF